MAELVPNTDWIEVLAKAANAGKKAIIESYDTNSRKKIVGRGFGGDLTLKIDEASETAIHESLNETLGEDAYILVSEELGEVKSKDDNVVRPVIVCDPLDGSHNAEVGIPLFSISLSVLGLTKRINKRDKRTFHDIDVGYILSVPTGDEFSAKKNDGAFHNSRRLEPRIEGNDKAMIKTLLVECGDADYLSRITRCISSDYVYKTRLLGSAAMSYCLLADGTADGFIFAQPGGARTIDSPAGYLIAKEAGCVFADALGKVDNIDNVELGFDSRISVMGGANPVILSLLRSKVRL
jgi:myo-inositol-1(or 4)-monophosphatase